MTEVADNVPFVVFDEEAGQHERMAAVLVVKDTETGNLKAYVKDVEGRQPPSEDAIALLVQSTELSNL